MKKTLLHKQYWLGLCMAGFLCFLYFSNSCLISFTHYVLRMNLEIFGSMPETKQKVYGKEVTSDLPSINLVLSY